MNRQTTNNHFNAGTLVLGVALALGVFATASVQAATRTWNGSAAPDLNWSTPANWDAALNTTGDSVVFNETGAVAGTTPVTTIADGNYSLVGIQKNISDATLWHNLQIADGNAVEVTGNIRLGWGIGHGTTSYSRMTVSGPGTFQLGTETTAANIHIADIASPATSGHATTDLTFSSPVDTVNLSSLRVAVGRGIYVGLATLDLSSATIANSGLFRVKQDLLIGALGDTQGTVTFGTSLDTLEIGRDLHIGTGDAGTTSHKTSSLNLADGTTLKIGSESARGGVVRIGDGGGSRDRIGNLVLANGNFEAHVTSITVGNGTKGKGTLDLRSSTVTNDVSGNVLIGGVLGNVYLGSGTTTIGGDLDVTRYLELFGHAMAVASNVTVGATGNIVANIGGTSAGLDLGSAAALTVATGGIIELVFESDPGGSEANFYWGLRWAGGDHTAALQALIDDGRLVIDTTALSANNQQRFGLFAVGGVTYIGVEIALKGTVMSIR